jgi:hypothetical protein
MEITEKASEKQVKYLHVLYLKLNWDEDMYRSMLLHNYQVASTSDLNKAQAFSFITKLHIILEQFDDRITDKQVYLVRQLWKVIDYSEGREGDVHLNAFILKRFKKVSVTVLTKQEGIKLIKQIGQMTKQAEERRGKTTVLRRKTKCVHCGKLIMWVQLKDGRREAFDCDENNNPTDFHKCR